MKNEIDAIITESLSTFAEELGATGWRGREREAISYYAFGHLLPLCRAGTVLFDPTQIGIEVAVPQLPGEERKAQVCKDLVIWPKPHMTCWDSDGQPTIAPLTVLEWKADRPDIYQPDVRWLSAFTATWPGSLAYAVTVDLQKRLFLLACTRIEAGAAQASWLTK